MAIGDVNFWTINFNTVELFVTWLVISKVNWQCDVEAFLDLVEEKDFKGGCFGCRLLYVYITIHKCFQLVEFI